VPALGPGELGPLTKAAFKINVRDLTITCPAGKTERIAVGSEFDPEACDHYKLAHLVGARADAPAITACARTSSTYGASAIQNLEAIHRKVA
jgi:hypothetical protein